MDLRAKRLLGLKKMIVTAVVVLVMIVLAAVYFPTAFLNQQVADRLTHYLVDKLGPEAVIADVKLGWRYALISDVTLPVDRRGSRLEIREIVVGVDPLALISQPERYHRVFRSVRVQDPRLYLRMDSKKDDAGPTAEPEPRRRQLNGSIQNAVFQVLAQLDSLNDLQVINGSVWIETEDTVFAAARELRCLVTKRGLARLAIDLNGYYLDSNRNRLSAKGEVYPNTHRLRLNGGISIPPGEGSVPGIDSLVLRSMGGEIALSVSLLDTNVSLRGDVDLTEAAVRFGEWNAEFEHLHAAIRDDRIVLDTADFHSVVGEGFVEGYLEHFRRPRLQFGGHVSLDSLARLGSLVVGAPKLEGDAVLDFSVTGTPDEPIVRAEIESDSMSVAGYVVRSVDVAARLTTDALTIDELVARSDHASFSGSGTVSLTGGDVDARGRLTLSGPPSIAGIESDLAALGLSVSGSLGKPAIGLTLIDSEGRTNGEGRVQTTDDQWRIELTASGLEDRASVQIEGDGDLKHVFVEETHVVLAALFPGMRKAARSLDRFALDVRGNEEHAVLTARVHVRPDSGGVSRRPLEEVQFEGQYLRVDDGTVELTGEWQGMLGSGSPFFGQGDVLIDHGVITLTNFFVDEVGTIAGRIDLPANEVSGSISIDDLQFSRLPVGKRFLERTGLDGSISGELRVDGAPDSMHWTSSLTLKEGTVFNVPGYWAVLDAEGTRLRVDSVGLSFGRGIQRIIEAHGHLDLGENQLNVRATSGSADAEDFFLALTGRHGMMTGALSGSIDVTGEITNPSVAAELSVADGELLGEIFVDRFAARVELTHSQEGKRVIRVPTLSFGKNDTYRFFGELSTEAHTGGQFVAHLEGSGDFLDIIDQVDRDFHTHGSETLLSMDFGGTYDQPEFVGGSLRMEGGRFLYPAAAPEVVGMEIDIRVVAPGVVESGVIRFDDEDRHLQVRFLQDYDEIYFGLAPLVIPSPRLDLGVLELTTGKDGMVLHLPGFMEPDWLGTLISGTGDIPPVTISGLGTDRLLFSGGLGIRSARMTFPFIASRSGRVLPVTRWILDRLYEARWDLAIAVGAGNHYDVEITGFKDSDLFAQMGKQPVLETLAEYLDHLSVDAIVEPTEEPLLASGMIEDSTFRLLGALSSTRGRVDYLDQTFTIDYVTADFDETDVMPIMEGRAETYGLDSLNRSVSVYLTIYEIDRETNTRLRQGRFEDVTYVLETEEGDSPEAILQLLGYGAGDYGSKAEKVLARTALTAAKRAWLDPLSRQIENVTLLDEVSLAPGGGRSERLFRQQRQQAFVDTTQQEGVVRFFTGSHVTVGKYVTDDIFLTYTGELVEGPGDLEGSRLGLVHFWNLELRMDRIARDLVLDLAVEYDETERRQDESVALKYTFALEP